LLILIKKKAAPRAQGGYPLNIFLTHSRKKRISFIPRGKTQYERLYKILQFYEKEGEKRRREFFRFADIEQPETGGRGRGEKSVLLFRACVQTGLLQKRGKK